MAVAALLLGFRLALGWIFLRAGSVKLADLRDFRLAVDNYRIVPAALVGVTAVAVPAIEVAAGLLLLLGVLPAVVGALTAALLVAFSLAVAVNLARGREFDCGCHGGGAPRRISRRHVLVNLLLALAALAVAVAPPAGFGLLTGQFRLVSLAVPASARLPVLLGTALCLLLARVLDRAAGARRLARPPAAAPPSPVPSRRL